MTSRSFCTVTLTCKLLTLLAELKAHAALMLPSLLRLSFSEIGGERGTHREEMGEEPEPPPLPPRNYSFSELENDDKGDSKLSSKVGIPIY